MEREPFQNLTWDNEMLATGERHVGGFVKAGAPGSLRPAPPTQIPPDPERKQGTG